jgi:hypothetical protein
MENTPLLLYSLFPFEIDVGEKTFFFRFASVATLLKSPVDELSIFGCE